MKAECLILKWKRIPLTEPQFIISSAYSKYSEVIRRQDLCDWICLKRSYFLGALSMVSVALVWPWRCKVYFAWGNLLISAFHICWASCVSSASVAPGSELMVVRYGFTVDCDSANNWEKKLYMKKWKMVQLIFRPCNWPIFWNNEK